MMFLLMESFIFMDKSRPIKNPGVKTSLPPILKDLFWGKTSLRPDINPFFAGLLLLFQLVPCAAPDSIPVHPHGK